MNKFLQSFMRWSIATPDPDHTFNGREILLFCGFVFYWVAMAIWLYIAFS